MDKLIRFSEEDFYDLKIGEFHLSDLYLLLRVPGGWVLEKWDVYSNGTALSSVFIPYINEREVSK